MKEKIVADKIYVDAGLILVADTSYLKDMGCTKEDLKELKRLGKTFPVKNGKYKVAWAIKNTWNGDIEGNKEIEISGSGLFVVDPCYIFQNGNQERWEKWLNDNSYGDNIQSNKAFSVSSMGGDGCYKVEITLENIKED